MFDLICTVHVELHCSGSKQGKDSKNIPSPENEMLREELEEQKGRAEAYLTQLRDGAKYVQTIQEQLEEVGTNTHLAFCLVPIFILFYFISFYFSLFCYTYFDKFVTISFLSFYLFIFHFFHFLFILISSLFFLIFLIS